MDLFLSSFSLVRILTTIPWYFSAILVIFGYILFSALVLIIIRSFFKTQKVKQFHDVASATFANFGVLYAVLIAFIFVEVQDRHNNMRLLIEQEAAILGQIYRDAEVFPTETKNEIRNNIKIYVQHIIDYEWQLMRRREFEIPTHNLVQNIWNVFYKFHPQNETEKLWYQEAVNKLNNYSSIRTQRWIRSQESMNNMMWTLLIFGAILSTIFLALFYVENFWVHLVFESMLGGAIAFLLFSILSFDNPFLGGAELETTPFKDLLSLFSVWK